MADDNFASTSTTTTTTPTAHATGRSAAAADYGAPKRAATIDDTAQLRRRSTVTGENPFNDPRRRSANFSDYSFNDGTQIFDSSADELFSHGHVNPQSGDKSIYAVIPLVFALMPAVGGMLFQNGSAFLTDVILLGLAAIFLHWSVTQPWEWYRSAQEIRLVKDELLSDFDYESDSDVEPSTIGSTATALEHVPEENEKDKAKDNVQESPDHASSHPLPKKFESRRDAAMKELWRHEIMALCWCFVFPLLGAYLLHTIRCQLSRPSEGLVSDYNLCIFIIAAEVRPVSHLIKLVQSRTIRLQRIVAANPHQEKLHRNQQIQELCGRMNELEARTAAGEMSSNASVHTDGSHSRAMEAALARNVREGMQPELDALNRAVRRYEKKLALLAGQMDGRLEYLDGRMNDAIALAAVAAKHSNSQGGFGSWLVEKIVAIVMFPIQTVVAIFTFPFRTVSSLLGRSKSRPTSDRSHRTSRSSRTSASSRTGSDRMSSRIARK